MGVHTESAIPTLAKTTLWGECLSLLMSGKIDIQILYIRSESFWARTGFELSSFGFQKWCISPVLSYCFLILCPIFCCVIKKQKIERNFAPFQRCNSGINILDTWGLKQKWMWKGPSILPIKQTTTIFCLWPICLPLLNTWSFDCVSDFICCYFKCDCFQACRCEFGDGGVCGGEM